MDKVLVLANEGLNNDAMAIEMIGMNWLEKIHNIFASKLIPKYEVLHKLLIYNIDPLTQHLDLSLERAIILFKLGSKVGFMELTM